MSRHEFLSWVVLIMLLNACSGDKYQEPSSFPTETVPVCLGDKCTQNQDDHDVASSITITATVSSCVEDRQLYAQSPAGLPGTLVYRFIQDTDTLHLIGGHSLAQRSLEIDDHSFYLIGFSPGGEWLAYRTGSPYKGIPQTLHLISSTGEVIQITPTELVPTETGSYSGIWGSMLWVNDQTLLLYMTQPDPDNPDAPPLVIKALLNPFTGEWHQSHLEGLERKPTGTVAFAPDMTRVLFFSEAEGRFPEVRLWDMVQQEVLWSREDALDTLFTWEKNWTGSAAWSPDSAWVAFTAIESRKEDNQPSGVGVYLLDREGVTGKIITDFDSQYGRRFTTGALIWSPDGRYLAMSVSIVSSDPDNPYVPENRFYLYDLKNDDLIDLCWFRGIDSGYNSAMRTLVWSPDSRYLAYVASPSVSENDQRLPRALILVDIYTGEVIELVENAVLLGGWSAHFTP